MLCSEIVGAFEFASARGAEPIAVRAFTPTVEEHGYEAPGSVVETNTEDWPFLVDSVSAELRARGLGIQRVLHPIVGVERDADGAIEAVLHPREASRRESVMHFDLDRRLPPDELAELEEALRKVLSDVRATVRDFPSMADRARRMVQLAGAGASRYADEEVDETVAFLEWLLHDNFIFLGYREYRFRDGAIAVVRDSGSGSSPTRRSRRTRSPCRSTRCREGVRERALEGDLLIVSKTNRLSRVHRHVRMDYIGVRRISAEGEIVGEARMLGLFTTKAYAEPASQTPLLHRKLRQILRSEDLIEGSHDYKAAVSLFDSFPKDELFAASTHDLRGAVVALLGLQGEQVRLLGRRDPDAPQRVADRRAAALALRRRAADAAAASCSASASRPTRSTPTSCSARASACRCTSASTRPRGCPTSTSASSSARSSRPRARGRTSCATRSSRATATPRGARSRSSGARASRATTRPRPRRSWPCTTSAASRAWRRSASRSSSGCRTSATRAASARASASTSPAARSSWPRRCRCSRTSACA